MSRLTFRARLSITLLLVSVIPLAVVAVGGVWFLRNSGQQSQNQDISDIAMTGGTMFQELNKIELPPAARQAVTNHYNKVDTALKMSMQARPLRESFTVFAAKLLTIAAIVLAVMVALVGRRLTRQYSAPLDEVVDWTGKIQRHETLPAAARTGAIPEFAQLQEALRELQGGLEQARSAELEAERLRAFGEVARRVAHEMKNPLTPIRLALLQLSRRAPADMREELDVIASESARLEAMAREFAELGRLPAGIAATVDLKELLEDLLKNTVPDAMVRRFHCDGEAMLIEGHYDPLRRAFSNIIRNGVEACHEVGGIGVTLQRREGWIEVAVSDSGPGIPQEKRELIFEPYYTEKGDGTGLGLAIVRQTIEQHKGAITVDDAPGGGTTFRVRLPA